MIDLRIDFNCELCKKNDFYTMPMKMKVNNKGDFIRSLNKYELVCRDCRQSYILEFTIKKG